MKKKVLSASVTVAAMALAGASWAAGDLSRANIQTVTLEMGTNEDGGMYFKPAEFTFETGKAYKLHMVNVDEIKHEVSLNEMVERIFTRKVEVETPDGELVTEVKGHIWEVEVGPHQAVDWYFVPVQTAEEVEITCEIEGHKEAGMHAIAHIR